MTPNGDYFLIKRIKFPKVLTYTSNQTFVNKFICVGLIDFIWIQRKIICVCTKNAICNHDPKIWNSQLISMSLIRIHVYTLTKIWNGLPNNFKQAKHLSQLKTAFAYQYFASRDWGSRFRAGLGPQTLTLVLRRVVYCTPPPSVISPRQLFWATEGCQLKNGYM